MRTRLLLLGVCVLLPLFMFICVWGIGMAVPSIRLPGELIYVCLLVTVFASGLVIFTAPISMSRRVALFFGALLVLAVQVLALAWLAIQFSRMDGIQ